MKLTLFLSFWVSVLTCCAQESLRFKSITRSNGSSITGVQSFHQDSYGYMWMGSVESDLIRFDGTNFRYYTGADFQSDLFPISRGVLIFEDRKEQLWVGTDVGSLFRYNRNLDAFTLSNDSTQSPRSRFFCFAEAPDGSFWLGTLGGGLIRFHPETKFFKQYKAEPDKSNSLPDNFITGLAYAPDGMLWISTTRGLCQYDSTTDEFLTYPLTNNNPQDNYRYRVIRSLLLLNEKLYLSTYGGLQVFDRITKKSEHFFHNPNNKHSLPHNSLFSAVEGDDGTLWIATYGGGLNQFDPKTGQFTAWVKQERDSESLSSNNLFSVYKDDQGLLWIGVADGTVNLINTRSKKFHAVKNLTEQPDGISQGWARTLYQENDSIFWIGFNGQGLNRLNLNTGSAKKFLHNPKNNNSLSSNSVSAIDQDAAGRIWIGMEGGGLARYDAASDKFTRHERDGYNSISNNAISALLVDGENILWATAYRDGLNLYAIDQDKFQRINNDSLLNQTGISLGNVEDIFELNDNVWFNSPKQVALYDKKHNTFVKVADAGQVIEVGNPYFVEAKPFSENEILLITQDEVKTLRYVSPDSIEQITLLKVDTQEPIKSFVVNGRDIWYITNTQLVRWNTQKNEKHVYTQSDGIPKVNLYSLHKDSQGRLFILSLSGITWFYPDQIVDDTLARNVVLTDFKLFNHSATLQPDSVHHFSLPGQPSQLKTITLNHNHSFFSIEFSALEFIAPEKIQYAYRLIGFDQDWVLVGNRTFASYTNLDPGQYKFEVKASNPDGIWNHIPTTLTVIINPPFWRTGWFISLIILAAGGLLYGLHRYRLTQTLEVERLRTKIASDLHDEVGSSLTKISIYSELVQNGVNEKEKAGYLNSIGTISREVVSTMSDIVWSIDNNNDSLHELTNRMKDFATEVLEAKGISFEFRIKTENRALDPSLRQNIYLIFKEAINNVVKHAQATHVKVTLATQPQFELRIEDNGIGFSEKQNQSGNGLRNMERRAKSMGGVLTTQTSGGTIIILRI